MQHDQTIRHARHNPSGCIERASQIVQSRLVHVNLAVLAAGRINCVGKPEVLRRFRTHHRGVVPRQPRDRLRQLLEPGVVRKPPVVHRRIRTKHDLVRAGFELARPRPPQRESRRSEASHSLPAVACPNISVIQRAPPDGLEIASELFLPVLAHDVVSGCFGLARKGGNDFVRRFSADKAAQSAAARSRVRRKARASLQDSRKCVIGTCHWQTADVSFADRGADVNSSPGLQQLLLEYRDRPARHTPGCRRESPAASPAGVKIGRQIRERRD